MNIKVTYLTKWLMSCVAAILLCASVGASAADNITPSKSDKTVEGKKSNGNKADSVCEEGFCIPSVQQD